MGFSGQAHIKSLGRLAGSKQKQTHQSGLPTASSSGDMKKEKTYEQYKEESVDRNKSIMDRYGAPKGARPPKSGNDPKPSDAQFRAMAFTKKRTLEFIPSANQRRNS